MQTGLLTWALGTCHQCMCHCNAETKAKSAFLFPNPGMGLLLRCVQSSQIYYTEAQGKEVARLVQNSVAIIYPYVSSLKEPFYSPSGCATSLKDIYKSLHMRPIEGGAQSARLGSKGDHLEVALG